jgi:PLP dependent protein
MDEVAERRARILERMAKAAQRAGRGPDSVHLLAVSKLQPAEKIRAAYAAGQRDFGENYAQELRDKAAELKLPELRWHAIGRLQTNKVKYVASNAWAFHAVDRLEVSRELDRRAKERIRCFIEVDVAGEATKAGVARDELPALVDEVKKLERVELVGLMCLPPFATDPQASRPHFKLLRELAQAHGLTELSMGTTQDFEVAIEEGATWVRIGTELFGERPS